MWNVNERLSQKAIESLAALGFGVGSTRGVVRVEKYGGGAEFRKEADGQYQMTVQPTIMLKGKFTRLWVTRMWSLLRVLRSSSTYQARCPRIKRARLLELVTSRHRPGRSSSISWRSSSRKD